MADLLVAHAQREMIQDGWQADLFDGPLRVRQGQPH